MLQSKYIREYYNMANNVLMHLSLYNFIIKLFIVGWVYWNGVED